MNNLSLQKKVDNVLKENKCWYDTWVNSDGTIEVNVEWGDWKHDHLFLEHIMSENNFKHIDEDVTEEDGSDTYSSIHTFRYVG